MRRLWEESMWIPVVIFCWLLGGAILWVALVGRFPRFMAAMAVALPFISLLFWLVLRGLLPLTMTLANWSATGTLPDLAWRIDAVNWPVTAWLLLLAAGMQTATWLPDHPGTPAPASRPSPPFILTLTAVTLAVIWSDSLTGMMMTWAVLLAVWHTMVWPLGGQSGASGEDSRFFLTMGLRLTAVLLLWLGAAAVPLTGPGLAASDWPEQVLFMVLVAVWLYMGIWPLAGWRPPLTAMPSGSVLTISLLPAAAGGVLLVRAAPTAPALAAGGLLLTLAGLFGLLHNVRKTWEQLPRPVMAVFYLTVAQMHLWWLTAVWGGGIGALAMLRTYLLAGGILFLAAGRPVTRQRWWRAVAPGIALAALAGLPLTSGLAGLSALYEGVQADGRIVVLLVLVLMQIPLVAAGLRLIWPLADEVGTEAAALLTPVEIVREVGMVLPAVGLVSLSGVPWGQLSWMTWLWLLAVPVGGGLLFRFGPEFYRTVAAVRRAFTWQLPLKQTAAFQQWLQGLGGAFQEAAAILEGDGSLLWLLILAVIFLLAR